jgi:hypothetical protein
MDTSDIELSDENSDENSVILLEKFSFRFEWFLGFDRRKLQWSADDGNSDSMHSAIWDLGDIVTFP